jgi:hypothetical protein
MRIQSRMSSGLLPAHTVKPKAIGSATPSITQAAPSSKWTILGTRSTNFFCTRAVHRSPGSVRWLSAEISRYSALDLLSDAALSMVVVTAIRCF